MRNHDKSATRVVAMALMTAVVSTSFSCAKRGSPTDAAAEDDLPIRPRVPAKSPSDFRVEVRPSSTVAGGPGWISSANVERLSRSIVEIAEIAKSKPRARADAAWVALSENAGRIPDDLRKRLRHLIAVPAEHRSVAIAKLVMAHGVLFADLCGDPTAMFERIATLPAEEHSDAIIRDCGLKRFGWLSEDTPADIDTLLAHGVLAHLHGLGGPHPFEEALLRVAHEFPGHQNAISVDAPVIADGPLAECSAIQTTRSVDSTGPVVISHYKCGLGSALVATFKAPEPLRDRETAQFIEDYSRGLDDNLFDFGPRGSVTPAVLGKHGVGFEVDAKHSFGADFRMSAMQVNEGELAVVSVCQALVAKYETDCKGVHDALLARALRLP